MELIIITGLSGAGRSQAMKAMEDIGYYCIDNLPPILLPKFAELCRKNSEELSKVALVIDIRGKRFFDDLDKSLEYLDKDNYKYEIVFLEANDKTLIKRFKESRRTHPLKPYGSIEEGIKIEREKLMHMRNKANCIIDTSNMNINQFKTELYKRFVEGKVMENMSISILSFGYKKGIPLEADLVFDLRVLPNPFYVEELKNQTGNDLPVQEYVMHHQDSQVYLNKVKHFIDFIIPLCIKEGRSQFVIAFGCTGGQHRSVTFTNLLGDYLEKSNHRVTILHRELRG